MFINIADQTVQARIRRGELKLRPGQRVSCGNGGPYSLWCGVTKAGTFVVTHPRRDGTIDMDKHERNLAFWRSLS